MVLAVSELVFQVYLNKNILFIQREAQEHRNEAADPFTRRRCAPTLVAKV
jgi:hypothetical protein